MADLSLYCNREYNALDSQLDNMDNILEVLISSLERLLDLISCHRIVPIYTDTSASCCHMLWARVIFMPIFIMVTSPFLSFYTVYDASCEVSTKALFWIYCCGIILGSFGFLMITLRASYKLTVEEEVAYPIKLNQGSRHKKGRRDGDDGDDDDDDKVDDSHERGRDDTRQGRESPTPASPAGAASPAKTKPETPPPVGEVRVDDNADDVYTAYTGKGSMYTAESRPMSQTAYAPRSPKSPRRTAQRSRSPRKRPQGDDDTVTREKKAHAIDVD